MRYDFLSAHDGFDVNSTASDFVRFSSDSTHDGFRDNNAFINLYDQERVLDVCGML